ncbi:MAG TPA: FHA domain-containing protein [Phototrophicaceae bacterium]|nr:FHA domain-containing protein [Phototrophicaceae bacterium]
MNQRFHARTTFRFIFCLLISGCVLAVSSAVSAQITPTPTYTPNEISAQAGFLAYACQFEPLTNTVTINAALAGADAQTMPPNSYKLAISEVGGSAITIPTDHIEVTPTTQRPPLQMILVMDETDTMPLPEIVTAYNNTIPSQLEPDDKIALLAFGSDIKPMTQFYTDKSRLASDNLTNVKLQSGDNHLYDALYQALDYFQNSTDTTTRRVVLAITDSGRRGTQQVATDDVIARAQKANAQVYFISFIYTDHPDVDDMFRISQATNGYGWVFDGERSRVAVGGAVADYLTNLVHDLSAEISMKIDLSGQNLTLTDSGVTFQVTVSPANDRTMTAQINCPVRSLHHSIEFANVQDNTTFTSPVNISVNVHSDMDLTNTHVAFWLNDVVVQDTSSKSYTINAPDLAPGVYTLRAELRDQEDQVLATTPTINTYVQQSLQLNTVGGSTNNLHGRVQFQANAGVGTKLPDIQFRVGTAADPNTTFPLGTGTAPLQPDGTATLTIDNLHDALKAVFPNEQGRDFVISAFVLGSSSDVPLLARSNQLAFSVATAPANVEDSASLAASGTNGSGGGTGGANGAGSAAAGAPVVAGIQNVTGQIAAWNNNPILLPLLAVIFMFILNVLLLRQVRRSRIYRMIMVPDDIDMSDRLMAITVRRAGTVRTYPLTKNTVYIGRGSQNDINVGDEPAISRSHGVIMWRRGGWYYTNRNPRSSTRFNGKRFRGYKLRKLEPVTELEIGSVHLYYHSNAQQDISELTKTNL